jgi:hypothetical protein
MLMNLSLNSQLRTESDQAIIQTLLRKGWVEAAQPAFNPQTHSASWVNGAWVVSEIVPEVPAEVPLWAFRAILTVSGIAQNVDAMLDALDEPQKTIAKTQWVYGNFIVRSHPLIVALGSQLGMTSTQIDDVFIQAASLV